MALATRWWTSSDSPQTSMNDMDIQGLNVWVLNPSCWLMLRFLRLFEVDHGVYFLCQPVVSVLWEVEEFNQAWSPRFSYHLHLCQLHELIYFMGHFTGSCLLQSMFYYNFPIMWKPKSSILGLEFKLGPRYQAALGSDDDQLLEVMDFHHLHHLGGLGITFDAPKKPSKIWVVLRIFLDMKKAKVLTEWFGRKVKCFDNWQGQPLLGEMCSSNFQHEMHVA